MLYELLTGTTPVDRKSLGKAALLEILRVVREVEAPRPSSKLSTIDALRSVAANRGIEPAKLTKLMKGELDWILLKALEKDRVRRYETANGFAMDVQRYLSGEAVQAHPPSTSYRIRKLVRRNKGHVIAASLVFFTLLAGMTGTVCGLIQARRHEQVARAEAVEKENARLAEAQRAEGERRAKQQAEANGAEAKKQEAEARKQEAEARKKLVRFRVATGTNAVDRGEVWDALVWYAKAWQDDTDIHNEPAHRMRIASTLSQAPKLRATFFHDMMVFDAQLSRDGSRLATITEDGIEALLFNTATQGVVARLTPETKVMAVAFSGDSQLLVTGSDDGVLRFWNAADGSVAGKPMTLDSAVQQLVFHPSRPILAASTEHTALTLIDLEQRVTLALAEPLAMKKKPAKSERGSRLQRYVAFSADGTRVLAAADDHYRVWESATGRTVSPILNCKGILGTDLRWKNGPGLSTDGRRTIGTLENGLAVMDVASGKVLGKFQSVPLGHVFASEFSPDGKLVMTIVRDAAWGSGELNVYDSQTFQLLHTLIHPRSTLAAVWSPDSQRILSASAGGEVHLWDAKTAKEVAPVNKHGISTSRIAFSADGKLAMVGDLDGTVRLWEYSPPPPLEPYDVTEGRDPGKVSESLDGRFRLMNRKTDGKLVEVVLFSAKTGKAILPLPADIPEPLPGSFSANGERILQVNGFGMGQVYDSATGRAVGRASKPISEKWARFSAINADGSLWAISGSGGRAEVFETATGNRLATFRHHYDVISVAFDTTGQRLATTSFDRTARVWDARTGVPVSPQLNHASPVFSAGFSPDGRWLVTGSGRDTIQLWDVRTGDPLGPPLIHVFMGKPWFDHDARSILFRDGENYFRWMLPSFTAPAGRFLLLPSSTRAASSMKPTD